MTMDKSPELSFFFMAPILLRDALPTDLAGVCDAG